MRQVTDECTALCNYMRAEGRFVAFETGHAIHTRYSRGCHAIPPRCVAWLAAAKNFAFVLAGRPFRPNAASPLKGDHSPLTSKVVTFQFGSPWAEGFSSKEAADSIGGERGDWERSVVGRGISSLLLAAGRPLFLPQTPSISPSRRTSGWFQSPHPRFRSGLKALLRGPDGPQFLAVTS
jgi:hypothetical protein